MDEFLIGLAQTVLGGIAVAGAVYLLIERRLRLKDASDHRRALDAQHDENRTTVLDAVCAELEGAAGMLHTFVTTLKAGTIPYPGFDVTGWVLVSQAVIFTTLKRGTVEQLTHAYNRMKTTNEQLAELSDLIHGSTAVLVHATVAGRRDDTEVAEVYAQYVEHGENLRAGIIDRLNELKPHLDNAIDAVKAELKRADERPASEIRYLDVGPKGYVG
jgi:hypothetical protein